MPDNSKLSDKHKILRKPDWLRVKMPTSDEYSFLKTKLSGSGLHTICESGNCPNQGECWAARTATFLIMGDVCTRNCKFCNVTSAKPSPPDPDEPAKVAGIIKQLGLKHAVITSVTRDDLHDGGASHWALVVREIRKSCPGLTIETLIPDFNADYKCLDLIVEVAPEVVSHNLETVRRITSDVRSFADYDRSLEVLRYLSSNGMKTKSGLMAGIGESDDEIIETMYDIFNTGCRILTIGQYLQPSRNNLPVVRYVSPETFSKFQQIGLEIGFRFVESAPLVRSSYHADKHV